jgi:hypothetical protein
VKEQVLSQPAETLIHPDHGPLTTARKKWSLPVLLIFGFNPDEIAN